VDTKFAMSQQCAVVTNKASSLLCRIRQRINSRRREVILLLSTGKTSGVLCPALGSTVQGRYGHIAASPAKGHKDSEWTGRSDMLGEAERSVTVQHVEGKAQGDFINMYKYLVGTSKEDRARFFSVVPVKEQVA